MVHRPFKDQKGWLLPGDIIEIDVMEEVELS